MRPYSNDQFQPISNLSTVVIVLLWIQVAAQAVQALLCVGELAFPNKFTLEEGTVTSAWIVGMAFVSTLQLPVYLACAIFYFKWQHRAYKNLTVISRADTLITTPGWGIAFWIIPIANLFMPYLTVRDIWRKSDPNIDTFSSRPPETPAALIFWWAFYVISQIAAFIATRVDILDKTADMGTVAQLHGVRSFMTMIAAALAVLVVKSIADRQATRFANLNPVDEDF